MPDDGYLKNIADQLEKNKGVAKANPVLMPVANKTAYNMNKLPSYEELSAGDVYPTEVNLNHGLLQKTVLVFWEVTTNSSISIEREAQNTYITNM